VVSGWPIVLLGVAANLQRWPDAQVLHNTFSGPNLTHTVLLADGSTGCTVTGNITTGAAPPWTSMIRPDRGIMWITAGPPDRFVVLTGGRHI